MDVLNQYPVKVLAIKEALQPHSRSQSRFWIRWLVKCTAANLPNYVIISAPSKELVDEDGLQSQPWRRPFQNWGYEAHYWFLRAYKHGGVVCQDRCMLVLRRQHSSVPPVRLPSQIGTAGGPPTARNLLKPNGIPHKAWIHDPWSPRDDYPDWVTEAPAPCVIVGETRERKSPVFSPDGSLPDSVGALILMDQGI
jgi:hypothetical protein